jgi:hypothetical protein
MNTYARSTNTLWTTLISVGWSRNNHSATYLIGSRIDAAVWDWDIDSLPETGNSTCWLDSL